MLSKSKGGACQLNESRGRGGGRHLRHPPIRGAGLCGARAHALGELATLAGPSRSHLLNVVDRARYGRDSTTNVNV